jgi:archaellum component FlaC
MPLDQETLAKLTTSLSGDVELYNKIINEVQTNDAALEEKDKEIQTTKQKLEEAEQRGQQYLGQISNLLSKIPVGSSQAPQSIEQKIEEIKNRSWQK